MLQLRNDEAVEISVFLEVVSSMPVATCGAEAEAACLVGHKDQAAETPRLNPEEFSGHDSNRDTIAPYRTGKDETHNLFRESPRRLRERRGYQRRARLAPSLTLATGRALAGHAVSVKDMGKARSTGFRDCEGDGLSGEIVSY